MFRSSGVRLRGWSRDMHITCDSITLLPPPLEHRPRCHVFFQYVGDMRQVGAWFPCRIVIRVSHPFYQVFFLFAALTVVQDALDFIFGHIIDGDWRGRWFQWRSVCNLGGVLVLSEEGDMKDRVYSQSSREV